MSRQAERDQAGKLGAMDAAKLIKHHLPTVEQKLTPPQRDKVQRVLDVDVLWPELNKKYQELDHKSVPAGQHHYPEGIKQRNPEIVRQRDQVWQQMQALAIAEKDRQVRIDHEKLLTYDAFKPLSDNPDEAGYLIQVAQTLARRGAWLRVTPNRSHTAQTQLKHNDPNRWHVWLSLGFDGQWEIPIGTGMLDRRALLDNVRFGAGYWTKVYRGPTLTLLEEAIDRVKYQREKGWNEHQWWWQHRNEFPIVSKVSDVFGGADWPDPIMWIEPITHITTANGLIHDGKLIEAGKFVALAAWQVHWRAQALQAYKDATLKGAQRAVDVLEIAAVAGEIAETVLTVIWVGQGIIRLLSKKGASEVVSTVAKESYVSAPARSAKTVEEKIYQNYVHGKAPNGKAPAPAGAGGGGSPAPAQVSKSTPAPGKSPTGSPVSKSTTPTGQQPPSGSTAPSGQSGPGGTPPTPPNPANPAAPLPNPDNEWEEVVRNLGHYVLSRNRRLPATPPTLQRIEDVRVRAHRLLKIMGRGLAPNVRMRINELIIQLDHLEMAGRVPPIPLSTLTNPIPLSTLTK